MTNQFHRTLNRMTLFTALLAIGLIMFRAQFLRIAVSNLYLNGIIIGVVLFGIGLCFVEIFKLLPEHKWLRAYIHGRRSAPLPPHVLRPVALMLQRRPKQISASALNSMLDMVLIRFENSRESMRYITNVLIFLGLLGTFWGLIVTIGGFADLVSALNFSDDSALLALQQGITKPLNGMGTAFTSSLLGLGGSLTIGFLSLQVQLAQDYIFGELQEFFATHTHAAAPEIVIERQSTTSDAIVIDNPETNNR